MTGGETGGGPNASDRGPTSSDREPGGSARVPGGAGPDVSGAGNIGDDAFDWDAERRRWRARREAWRRERMASGGWHAGPPFGSPGPPFGRRRRAPFGCLGLALLAFVVFAAAGAFVTWVLGSLFGFVAPHARPTDGGGIAIALILLVAIAIGGRAFAAYVRPLASLADATQRLADGEPGVRVWPRGPRPVRDLAVSFNAMAERLDRSRASRQAMLADVTHELRTPLTVIGGGLEAMLDGVHPIDADHVAPLLAETQVMQRLLEDLRTLSLAEAGALPLHREPCDLAEVAADAAAAQRTAAEAKGVTVALAGDQRLEASVDPVRVREMVTNLLTNAIRHTPSGGRVDVTVEAVRGDAVIVVRDTGEGIAPDDLPHVFDRFERRMDSGGSGLGLTIVRDLATAHGGSVEASSDGIGLGATFRIRLPIRN